MNKKSDSSGSQPIASNRKARHDYTILDVVEAGIVLHGSEVKSLRAGQVQIADAYAHIVRGEMWLEGVHIAPYSFAVGAGAHEPMRARKLLLHSEQIRRLQERMAKERLTLVPLSLHLKKGRVKVELGLAKGRQKADRRQAIAEKESQIEIRRAQGRQRKGMTA
ncbi:MAG: SsrA-binding protein SmpB [Actinomycetota bacterium]